MSALTSVELNRLRWQCRRGLLENDLILQRFLDTHAGTLQGDRLVVFKELLELGDNELWDILSGRVDCRPGAAPAALEIVKLLRTC